MTAEMITGDVAARLRDLAGDAAAARRAYLDLLKATLTGMIYQDPPITTSWNPRPGYRHYDRLIGFDWPQHAPCMIGPVRLGNVQACVEQVIADGIPGDLAECLPGDALVRVPAGRPVRAVRQSYSGPLIKIATACGDQLAATPDHPVLTRRGWVPAGAIKEGDYVVGRSGLERMGLGDPDVDDVPAPIGEVFDTLQGRPGERRAFPAVHLNCRTRRGQVQVVTADGLLRPSRVTAFGKPARQQHLAGPDLGPVAFPSGGFGRQGRFAPPLALLGPGAESQHLPDGRVAPHAADHGITAGMPAAPRPAYGFTDRAAVAPVIGGDGGDGLTGEVAADRVVSVRAAPYSGHVFNLQTTTGWYLAGNILVHNCGVWRGGTCIFMRALLRAAGVTDRDVWVMDSFAGLPRPGAETEGWAPDSMDQLAVPLAEVQANFERYGLLDGQVRFLPGWFADTLPAAPVGRLAVLRMDADLYSSTTTILDCLYPKVSPGGFIIVDDWTLPARKATEDYRAAHGITDPIRPVDGAPWNGAPLSAYWRKT